MTFSRDGAAPQLLPYRPCVGVVLINAERKVWIGKRRERFDTQTQSWQMPQGGIDRGEDPAIAALRELAEETGTGNAEIIGRTDDWLTYDLPPERVGIALKGRYRGQKQIWFAMRYLGGDSDFNILEPPGGHKPEFDDWRWADAQEVIELIVPFKQPVYKAVFEQFRPYLA
ncbi:MAG: RNA pyrophosphohydrolase [Hyphomicrobiales bacterium]|nr:RNA pyrophosphohydrolase [Hyphomicrobiales bacterium]